MNFRYLAIIFASIFIKTNSSFAVGLEPKNPTALCERFLSIENQKSCEEQVKKIGPDWYLAAVCENIFEDSHFFSCLEMSRSANFNPRSLEKCASSELDDEQKLSCLGTLAAKDLPSTGRKPASHSKKK